MSNFMNDDKFWDNYTKNITDMAYEEQCHQDEEDNNVEYVDDSQREYMEMQAMYLDNMLECL